MPTTMADVARVAGVSTATVSHVLNQSRKISPATEKKVTDAIAELGYIPDLYARSLRTGASGIVGIAMSAISNPHFAPVVQELERRLSALGKSIILADTHDDPDTESDAVRELLARRVDGLVLAPSGSAQATIDLAHRHKTPLVIVDRVDERYDCDQVGVENVKSVQHITTHLLQLGHTRIGMVSGLAGISTSDERVRGFVQAHNATGTPLDPALIASGQSNLAGAQESATSLLQLQEPPTALVTGNNAMTIGALRALKNLGLSVPTDIALVCFDDFEWADLFDPKLSALAQPVEEIASRAVEMLTTRSHDASTAPRHETLQPTFMHRTSCGCHQSQSRRRQNVAPRL